MIGAIESAIIARIRAASEGGVLGYRLRTVTSYGGELDDDNLAKVVASFPAVWVVSDSSHRALQHLRTAVVRDLTARAPTFPALLQVRPAATLPALLLAYQVSGDPATDAEIARRNRLAHPGFVPGSSDILVRAHV